MRLAENTGRKKVAKNCHLGTIGLYLRPLAAEIGLPVWGILANFNGFRVLAALLHGGQVVGITHEPNFAALNRGRHLCSAGRPSRWALTTF